MVDQYLASFGVSHRCSQPWNIYASTQVFDFGHSGEMNSDN